MKRLLTTSVLALGAFVAAADTSAQTRFGLGGGYSFDDPDAPFISAQIRTSRGASIPVRFNPHADFFFEENRTAFQVGLNGLYDFGVSNVSFTPYVGLGLGVGYDKAENADEGDAKLGAQFLFGAEFNAPTVRPYLQVQISTNRGAGIGAGILF